MKAKRPLLLKVAVFLIHNLCVPALFVRIADLGLALAAAAGSQEMSSAAQRVAALQAHLAAALAEQEQEVEAGRAQGEEEEVARAEEAGRGSSQDGKEPREKSAEVKGSLEAGGGRAAMDGAL